MRLGERDGGWPPVVAESERDGSAPPPPADIKLLPDSEAADRDLSPSRPFRRRSSPSHHGSGPGPGEPLTVTDRRSLAQPRRQLADSDRDCFLLIIESDGPSVGLPTSDSGGGSAAEPAAAAPRAQPAGLGVSGTTE